jgi:hypothetical protein
MEIGALEIGACERFPVGAHPEQRRHDCRDRGAELEAAAKRVWQDGGLSADERRNGAQDGDPEPSPGRPRLRRLAILDGHVGLLPGSWPTPIESRGRIKARQTMAWARQGDVAIPPLTRRLHPAAVLDAFFSSSASTLGKEETPMRRPTGPRLSWAAFVAVMVPFLIIFGLFLRMLRG